MIDLKITDEEIKEAKKNDEGSEICCDASDSDNRIPWNLNFSLNDRELKKLGIPANSLKVGSEFTASVTIHVRSVEEREDEERGKKGSSNVAIVAMDVDKPKSDKTKLFD
tara:strand:- start:18582 stop:18911 length:330 start_codon:yes stop_codon:yes gene_type:complete